MGRVNKSTEGVFTNIVGNRVERSSYNQFISFGDEVNNNEELNEFLRLYNDTVSKHKMDFQMLADLEVIIMQLRSKNDISDIKLSLVREYIYARCSFYRNDKTSKDIRVIVDNVEFWRSDLTNLIGNKDFMEKANFKLVKAMDKEIYENITNFKKIYK
jgi:hypothetical protein